MPRGTRYAMCMTCDAKSPTFAFDNWTDQASDAAIAAWLAEHGWLELPKGERRRVGTVNVCGECAGEIGGLKPAAALPHYGRCSNCGCLPQAHKRGATSSTSCDECECGEYVAPPYEAPR